MKMRWAAALILLAGFCINRAWADGSGGFGFTVKDAIVHNAKAAGNTDNLKAEVNDTFTITGASFLTYRSVGADTPAIADADLYLYVTDMTGKVDKVDGNRVHYTGTFSIRYTGTPAKEIVTGSLELNATYAPDGTSVVTGFLTANPLALPTAPPWNKEFSPFNPGRFFGVYTPKAGDYSLGSITANVNAGSVGFAASIQDSVVHNVKVAPNTDPSHAEVGDKFNLSAPLASYFPTENTGLLPLMDNDKSRYTFSLDGTVTNVMGTTVDYTGTFSVKYTGPAYLSGVIIETGTFTLTAAYNDPATASAKLSGKFMAEPGYATTEPAWANTDFAFFNPATFSGTYTPDASDPTKGVASGSLIGGILGFSVSIAEGDVTNTKADPINGDPNKAEVGDKFDAKAPLAAYLAVGAPPLTDRDLSKYEIALSGTVQAVSGTTVVYGGNFTISFKDGAFTANLESGTFTIVALYSGAGNAILSGILTAKAGAETALAPFDLTDYAPFNPATFTGEYTKISVTKGNLRGGLLGGTLAVPIQSRKLGAAIEGSATAATQTDDTRRAIVASGSTLFVLDPATGSDAPGWEGGKVLPDGGAVIGRAAVLQDDVYVATSTGMLYRFDLKTGVLLNSGKPAGGGRILSAPAPDFATGKVYVVVSDVGVAREVWAIKLDKANFVTPEATRNLSPGTPGIISTVSPSVPNGKVFLGTTKGLFTLDGSDLAVLAQSADPVFTSPLTVGSGVYVGIGTGTTLQKLNPSTGVKISSVELASPLMIGAFYEKRTDLIQAGTADGHIYSFDNTGASKGFTLPGLFNPENTGGSFSMPVESNNVIYRATQNKEIISGKPMNGDDQQTIAVIKPVTGAMSATGQIPGADYLIATSADGTIHLIGVR